MSTKLLEYPHRSLLAEGTPASSAELLTAAPVTRTVIPPLLAPAELARDIAWLSDGDFSPPQFGWGLNE